GRQAAVLRRALRIAGATAGRAAGAGSVQRFCCQLPASRPRYRCMDPGGAPLMATAHPKLGLRPYLPSDLSMLVEIFRASITDLTGDDYSEAQQQAWAAHADDAAAFAKRLGSQLTLI